MATVLNNIVGGALNSAVSSVETSAISAIKTLLVTRQGATGSFDPVWKMNSENGGNPAKNVAGDPAGANAPKLKFNYTVAFEFNNAIMELLWLSMGSTGADPRLGSKYMDKMAFQVKTASRPNPNVVYQDVNFYNYRTKVATKVDYGTCTIVFYDDVQNWAHDIYTLYLQTISPIANVQNAIYAPNFDGIGVNPQNGDPSVSSLGPLPNEQESGLINSITVVHQLPLDYSQATAGNSGTLLSPQAGSSLTTQLINLINPFHTPAAPSAGQTSPVLGAAIQTNTVQYVYMNPKIVNFNLDDLDMTQSDVSTVSLTFTYDTVYISTVPIDFTQGNSASASTTSPITPGSTNPNAVLSPPADIPTTTLQANPNFNPNALGMNTSQNADLQLQLAQADAARENASNN